MHSTCTHAPGISLLLMMESTPSIAVLCLSPQLMPIAQQLADTLQLQLVQGVDTQYEFFLQLKAWPGEPGYALELQQGGRKAPGPVLVDFTSGKSAHRRRFGGGRGQALARAVGLRPRHNPKVLDVSAGLGKDAFVLASLGCDVTLVERNRVIHALLDNGIDRARHNADTSDIAMRMHCIGADAIEYLASLPASISFDVIYIDPMYPGRTKSALVKKEMRYFQAIAGKDEDADQLLIQALHSHARRIVVKRPAGALPLAGKNPQAVVSSKNTRYDIYLRH